MGFIRRQLLRFRSFLIKVLGLDLWAYTVFFVIGLLILQSFNYLPALYNFKDIAIEDIDISDLYYQSQPHTPKDSIIIVNTGTVPEDTISGKRRELTTLINAIQNQKPRRIGVDMYFVEEKKDLKVNEALGMALHKDNVIMATDGQAKHGSFEQQFLGHAKRLGCIIIPPKEHATIREYFNYFSTETKTYNSFANECAGLPLNTEQDSTYLLKYCVKGKGYFNINKDSITRKDVLFSFPAVEASYVLRQKNNPEILNDLFQGKIVLLGHLGTGDMDNPYDIEDKHKTPTEKEFISKKPIMPGVVIHANAIVQKGAEVSLFGISGLLELFLIFVYLYGYNRLLDYLETHNLFLTLALEIALAVVNFFFICWASYSLMRWDIHFNPLHMFVALLVLGELRPTIDKYKETLKPEK